MRYLAPIAGLLLTVSSPALATNQVVLQNSGCSLTTGCLFSGNADPNTVSDLMSAYNSVKDPDISLTWLGATGDGFAGNGQKTGTWTFSQPVDYLAVKAGNQFMLYFVGGVSSGSWSTQGLLNPNGNKHPQLGLSHLAFYSGLTDDGNPQGVPEPASWAMMLGGFGAMGAVLRSKKRVQSLA